MSRRDLIQFAADVGVSGFLFAGDRLGRLRRRKTMVEAICGVDGGAGTDPGHRCMCIRRLPHAADGSGGGPESFHACACGAIWTDEVPLGNSRIGQVKRYPSPAPKPAPTGWGPDPRTPQFPEVRTADPLEPRPGPPYPDDEPLETDPEDYVFDYGSNREEVHDITEVYFAPGHVVFLRDGHLIRAVNNDRIWDLRRVHE